MHDANAEGLVEKTGTLPIRVDERDSFKCTFVATASFIRWPQNPTRSGGRGGGGRGADHRSNRRVPVRRQAAAVLGHGGRAGRYPTHRARRKSWSALHLLPSGDRRKTHSGRKYLEKVRDDIEFANARQPVESQANDSDLSES